MNRSHMHSQLVELDGEVYDLLWEWDSCDECPTIYEARNESGEDCLPRLDDEAVAGALDDVLRRQREREDYLDRRDQ